MIKYKALVRVAELGSVTAAARDLGYSQPAVSHMLASLEKEMGFSLLVKNKGRMELTDDGKVILKYCYTLLRDERALYDAAASVRGMVAGSVRLGALNSMILDFLPSVIEKFSRTYSNIELMLQEYPQQDLRQSLIDGQTDIGFMTDDVPRGYSFYPLFRDPVVLLMQKGHPLSEYDRVPVQALSGCDFIMPIQGWDDIVQVVMSRERFQPVIRHRTASDTAGISMVSRGMGVYICSLLQARALPANVIYREFAGNYARSMGACIRSRASASPAQREFLKAAERAAALFQEELLE